MVVKKQENQSLNEDSKYIVVTLAGDRKIILPIKDGFQFMEIMAGGIQVKSMRINPRFEDRSTLDVNMVLMLLEKP